MLSVESFQKIRRFTVKARSKACIFAFAVPRSSESSQNGVNSYGLNYLFLISILTASGSAFYRMARSLISRLTTGTTLITVSKKRGRRSSRNSTNWSLTTTSYNLRFSSLDRSVRSSRWGRTRQPVGNFQWRWWEIYMSIWLHILIGWFMQWLAFLWSCISTWSWRAQRGGRNLRTW